MSAQHTRCNQARLNPMPQTWSATMDFLELMRTWNNMGGMLTHMGIELDDSSDPPEWTMTLTPQHAGSLTVAHGGALMVLLDTAIGAHVLKVAFERGLAASTVEMKFNMIKPAIIGHTVRTICEVISTGRTLVVARGEVRDIANDKLLAVATGTFNLYESELISQILGDHRSE